MSGMSRRDLVTKIGAMAGFALLGETAWAASRWSCGPEIDMPISIAIGTVETAPFAVKKAYYQMWFRAKRVLPSVDLLCMLGTKPLFQPIHCDLDPLLDLGWVVLDGTRIVAQGSVSGRDNSADSTKDYYDLHIGGFFGESKKKYVVQLKFSKDGGALAQTGPRLIIQQNSSFWCSDGPL